MKFQFEFSVVHADDYRAIRGRVTATADVGAILGQWARDRWLWSSDLLAREMGFAFVALRDPADEAVILERIRQERCE